VIETKSGEGTKLTFKLMNDRLCDLTNRRVVREWFKSLQQRWSGEGCKLIDALIKKLDVAADLMESAAAALGAALVFDDSVSVAPRTPSTPRVKREVFRIRLKETALTHLAGPLRAEDSVVAAIVHDYRTSAYGKSLLYTFNEEVDSEVLN
jgi:hypothetical protein